MFSSVGARTRAAIGLAGALFLIATGSVTSAVSVAAATPPPITFWMEVYGPCLGGYAGGGTTISVVWRDSAGVLKARGDTQTADYGQWGFCSGDQAVAVMPGDRVKVSDGTYTRDYVVPKLTIRADRVKQLYEGTGPAGRTIGLWIPNGDYERRHSVRVGLDGTWSFRPADGLGGSFIVGYTGYVAWNSPNSDHLEAYAYYPQIGVTLGKPSFYGTTAGFSNVVASISGARHGTGSATSDGVGTFSGIFRDASGHSISVSPGDHVSAPAVASNADWIVPNIEGSADKTTEIVTGKCYDTGTSAGLVGVEVIRYGGHVRGASVWHTDADGSFVADFTSYTNGFSTDHANIKTGDRIKIDCIQTTGDFARLTFVVR